MSFLISIWRIFVNFLSHRFPVKFNFNCLFCLQLQGAKSISKQTFLASVLFSRCRSSDNTPENCLFQIALYSRAYVRMIYEKTPGANSPGTLIRKTKHTSYRGLSMNTIQPNCSRAQQNACKNEISHLQTVNR